MIFFVSYSSGFSVSPRFFEWLLISTYIQIIQSVFEQSGFSIKYLLILLLMYEFILQSTNLLS
jgi:hypothetical protein